MARVLFHEPHLVVLDEVSSHMDTKSEQIVHKLCKKHGILMLSVGHRKSLAKYHDKIYTVKDKKVVELKQSTEDDTEEQNSNTESADA